MLCLSVCMFSLYGCSNEDSPTNSDGSFEGLDVTNLKRGDVVGAQYVKNEAGHWLPLKFTPLSEGDFNVEVTNRAWRRVEKWFMNEKGKAEKPEFPEVGGGHSLPSLSFDEIGECTAYDTHDVTPPYRYQTPYKYDAATGAFSLISPWIGNWHTPGFVIGLEFKDGKAYLWATCQFSLDCYEETTKDELMKIYPYEWDEIKDRYENAGGAN